MDPQLNENFSITFREFESKDRESAQPLFEKLRNYQSQSDENKNSERKAKILGLQVKNNGIEASHWVGIVWIEEGELAVRVEPKRGYSVEVRMLEKCLQFPQIADRLLGKSGIEGEKGERAFFFWPEQKPIKVEKEVATSAYLFLIAEFLYELKKLCERHLKRQFPRIEENLKGKVKGRILVKENIRRNVVHGRPDRVYCQFQTHSLDTKENQILKAALEVALSYLSRRDLNFKTLWTMGQFCRNALAEVSPRRIFPRDFSGLRLTGIMKHYKKPIELAKVILQKIASEPNPSKFQQKEVEVFPYAIDMNQLFERYCEALLRSEGIEGTENRVKPEAGTLWAGSENLTADRITVRPDFLFIEKENGKLIPVVADAKYKYEWDPNNYREDVYQVVAYTRHKAVQKKLGILLGKQEEIIPEKIFIFYPKENEEEKETKIEGFDIEIVPLPIDLWLKSNKK